MHFICVRSNEYRDVWGNSSKANNVLRVKRSVHFFIFSGKLYCINVYIRKIGFKYNLKLKIQIFLSLKLIWYRKERICPSSISQRCQVVIALVNIFCDVAKLQFLPKKFLRLIKIVMIMQKTSCTLVKQEKYNILSFNF